LKSSIQNEWTLLKVNQINLKHLFVVNVHDGHLWCTFQFGRARSKMNDFKIYGNIKYGSRIPHFAFRILHSEDTANKAKIFAGGNDENQKLVFRDSCQGNSFTSNSVFLKNPKSGLWYEVSCEGNIFLKTQGGERIPVEEETNHLQDGSLINVGYSTFLWKFRENLNTLPQRAELEDSLSINLFDSTKSNNDSYIILPRGPEDKGLDIYACRECGCIQLKNISPNDTQCKCKMQKMFFDPQLVFFTNMAETYCAFTPCGHVINKEAAM
jgi:hypothetical protein